MAIACGDGPDADLAKRILREESMSENVEDWLEEPKIVH